MPAAAAFDPAKHPRDFHNGRFSRHEIAKAVRDALDAGASVRHDSVPARDLQPGDVIRHPEDGTPHVVESVRHGDVMKVDFTGAHGNVSSYRDPDEHVDRVRHADVEAALNAHPPEAQEDRGDDIGNARKGPTPPRLSGPAPARQHESPKLAPGAPLTADAARHLRPGDHVGVGKGHLTRHVVAVHEDGSVDVASPTHLTQGGQRYPADKLRFLARQVPITEVAPGQRVRVHGRSHEGVDAETVTAEGALRSVGDSQVTQQAIGRSEALTSPAHAVTVDTADGPRAVHVRKPLDRHGDPGVARVDLLPDEPLQHEPAPKAATPPERDVAAGVSGFVPAPGQTHARCRVDGAEHELGKFPTMAGGRRGTECRSHRDARREAIKRGETPTPPEPVAVEVPDNGDDWLSRARPTRTSRPDRLSVADMRPGDRVHVGSMSGGGQDRTVASTRVVRDGVEVTWDDGSTSVHPRGGEFPPPKQRALPPSGESDTITHDPPHPFHGSTEVRHNAGDIRMRDDLGDGSRMGRFTAPLRAGSVHFTLDGEQHGVALHPVVSTPGITTDETYTAEKAPNMHWNLADGLSVHREVEGRGKAARARFTVLDRRSQREPEGEPISRLSARQQQERSDRQARIEREQAALDAAAAAKQQKPKLTEIRQSFDEGAPQWLKDSVADADPGWGGRDKNPFRKASVVRGREDGAFPASGDPATIYSDQGPRKDDNPESPWQGSWSVNHFYYGQSHTGRRPEEVAPYAMRQGGGGADHLLGVSQWAMETVQTGEQGRRLSQAVWDRRDEISAIVKQHGGGRARIGAKINSDGSLSIHDYDYRRWEHTLPATGRGTKDLGITSGPTGGPGVGTFSGGTVTVPAFSVIQRDAPPASRGAETALRSLRRQHNAVHGESETRRARINALRQVYSRGYRKAKGTGRGAAAIERVRAHLTALAGDGSGPDPDLLPEGHPGHRSTKGLSVVERAVLRGSFVDGLTVTEGKSLFDPPVPVEYRYGGTDGFDCSALVEHVATVTEESKRLRDETLAYAQSLRTPPPLAERLSTKSITVDEPRARVTERKADAVLGSVAPPGQAPRLLYQSGTDDPALTWASSPDTPADVALDRKTGGLTIDIDDDLVVALVSITGVVDEVDDLPEPGVYAETLRLRIPKGIWSHDWDVWVSRTEAIEELMPGDSRLPATTRLGDPWPREAGGLLVATRFNTGTQPGREALSNVRFFDEGPLGPQTEWSVGYNVRPGKAFRRRDGVRVIRSWDCFEYGPVLFGAASLSGTLQLAGTKASAMRQERRLRL